MMLQGLPRSSLQLASVACELIAAKHEEVRPCCSPATCYKCDAARWSDMNFKKHVLEHMYDIGIGLQERYPSVSGFTSIADNCFQVTSSAHTSRDLAGRS